MPTETLTRIPLGPDDGLSVVLEVGRLEGEHGRRVVLRTDGITDQKSDIALGLDDRQAFDLSRALLAAARWAAGANRAAPAPGPDPKA